jgi:hypothetical protein
MATCLSQMPRDDARLAKGMRRFQTRQIWIPKSHGIRCSLSRTQYIVVLVRRVKLILTNQRLKQGFHSLAAPRSRLLSTNPSTKKVQDQNPSAEVAQANRTHLVTLLSDWSFRHPFSCVKNIPRHGRNVTSEHTFSERDYDWSPFQRFLRTEGCGSPCRAAVSDFKKVQ